MPRFKQINNERIQLTAEEETQFLADQKAIQDKEKVEQDIINANKIKRASGKQKLKNLGLDDDEIQALIGV